MTNYQWNLSSRVHPLNGFPNQDVSCYVKRDDELGAGISGSKLRKYASLVPFWVRNGINQLVIIAGPQSNNLLAALQVGRELNMQITAFLLKPWTLTVQGNFMLSRLFLADKDIVWVERKQWPRVLDQAQEYLHGQTNAFILEEGSSVAEALDGAMTLAADIKRNEQEVGFSFDHIFIDAGTGFSAIALIKGMVKAGHQAMIHVLLLADDEDIFNTKIVDWLGYRPTNYTCFIPHTAKAFGSVNQTIKQEIKRLAQEEGMLADPIYSAKLFHEARKKISESSLLGNVLIIHSGGTLTMAGFEL